MSKDKKVSKSFLCVRIFDSWSGVDVDVDMDVDMDPDVDVDVDLVVVVVWCGWVYSKKENARCTMQDSGMDAEYLS